ncbi:hypothetical protein BST61_g7118 [Cercospora zeina]
MANSEFSYVKNFETPDSLPLSTWIVVRIDGRGFSKLCKKYNFTKPNDKRVINLMNSAAVQVVKSFHDIVLAYGQSDEYSFVFHENTALFERRSAKLSTSVATMFTAEYVMQWREFFPDDEMKLERPFPTFDGRRIVISITSEKMLKGTLASDKNEVLWKDFGVNYNDEEEVVKKGSVLYRAYDDEVVEGGGEAVETGKQKTAADPKSKTQLEKERKRKMKARIVIEHTDIIGNAFWEKRQYILATKKGAVYDE